VAVTLYNISVYGFWIAIIFFTVLTIGFVFEMGSGALYFTDQRSSISPKNDSLIPDFYCVSKEEYYSYPDTQPVPTGPLTKREQVK
jgi:hypothetical protein